MVYSPANDNGHILVHYGKRYANMDFEGIFVINMIVLAGHIILCNNCYIDYNGIIA